MPYTLRHALCLTLLPVALVVTAGCSTPRHAGDEPGEEVVQDVTWEWVETVTPDRRISVERPERYTLRLKQNGEAQIRYDCNHGGSLYEISGSELMFGPLTATRIHCGTGSQGILYMRQLDVVVSHFTKDGNLFLELPDRSGTMRFRRSR